MVGSTVLQEGSSQAGLEDTHWRSHQKFFTNKMVEQVGGDGTSVTHFGDIGPFLEELENVDIAPKISDHLRQLLACELDRKALIMELAAVVDAGEPFVKAT